MLVLIVGFLAFAGLLYCLNFGENPTTTNSYLLKVADALITGAIVGLFVALVKWIFGIKNMYLDNQLLVIPPPIGKTVKIILVITVLLVFAFGLYHLFFVEKPTTVASSYLIKVADASITGAIVGLFVALVKLFFDVEVDRRYKKAAKEKADNEAAAEAAKTQVPISDIRPQPATTELN